jgi:hypothetical protein
MKTWFCKVFQASRRVCIILNIVSGYRQQSNRSKTAQKSRKTRLGQLKAIRILVYARLKKLQNDTRVTWHLKNTQPTSKCLDCKHCSAEPQLDEGVNLPKLLEETFKRTADIIQVLVPTTHLIADSTPLVDLYDLEAKWGFSIREPFKGFKLHAVVKQLGLPLKAIVSLGNRFNSIFLPKLIEDLEAQYVLADAGYHSLKNIKVVEAMGAVPVIAVNLD